jgi:hypothetical protein
VLANVSLARIRIWALALAIIVLAVLYLTAMVPFLQVPNVSPFARSHVPLILALLGVLLVFSCALLVQGKNDILLLFQSEGDKKLSVSKVQLYLWTSVIAFSYIYIVAWNYGLWGAHLGSQSAIPAPVQFPWTVLLALGLSVGTFGLAKGLAVGSAGPGQSAAPANAAAPPHAPMMQGLVASDVTGAPDITKIQMLAWTVIAAVVYIADTVAQIALHDTQSTLVTSLPEIDYALLVLTGLAQGTYIGNKLIVPRGPVLSSLAPETAATGTTVHVFGSGFGSAGSVLVGGNAVQAQSWSDTDVAFQVPSKPNTNPPAPYGPGDPPVDVAIVCGGTRSANALPLRF